jgi:hypothetical protein
VSTIALLCLVRLLCTPVQLDCSLAALQANLLFTPVNTCSVYSLEALQANFEDPFLEPPTVDIQRLLSLLVNPMDSAIGWPLYTVFFINGSSSWRSRSQILFYRSIRLDHQGVVGTCSLFNVLSYASSLYESSSY